MTHHLPAPPLSTELGQSPESPLPCDPALSPPHMTPWPAPAPCLRNAQTLDADMQPFTLEVVQDAVLLTLLIPTVLITQE